MHRVVLAALLVSACRVEDKFVCASDEQCRRDGMPAGTCESSSYCSFPDVECESGRRYDPLSELPNQCVLDRDKDMVADDDDNCDDKPNPEQYDEDKDGFGDICDPCPPFSDNSDVDNDGVGGLCDQRPTIFGDTIVYFEGFHSALTGWTPVVGSANVENDALMLQGRTDMDLPVTNGGKALLLAGVTLVQAPTKGVWLGLPWETGVGGTYCELTPTKLQLFQQDGAAMLLKETAFTAKIGESYVYGIERSGMQQYRCVARLEQATDDVVLSHAPVLDGASQRVGLGADVTTRFTWVMIVHE